MTERWRRRQHPSHRRVSGLAFVRLGAHPLAGKLGRFPGSGRHRDSPKRIRECAPPAMPLPGWCRS